MPSIRSVFRAAMPLLVATSLVGLPSAGRAQIDVTLTATIAPPPIPVYTQPVIAGPGYIWIPGYWAYAADGYFWVPGTWVLPPSPGLLWTPGYWGWADGAYRWNAGYWGPRVGFYGGINYGYGYSGNGYQGGYWEHGHFFYNRAANNIGSVHVTNVYDRPVPRAEGTRVSFNGGNGGTHARPSAQDEAAAHERHVAATAQQTQQVRAASSDRALFAATNHGHPTIGATPRAGAFENRGGPGPGATPGHERDRAAGAPAATPENRAAAEHRPPGQPPAAAARTPAQHAPIAAEQRPADHAPAAPQREAEHAPPRQVAPLAAPREAARPAAQPQAMRHEPAPPREARPAEPARQAAPLVAPRPQPHPVARPAAVHAPAPAAHAPAHPSGPAHPSAPAHPAAKAPEHEDHH